MYHTNLENIFIWLGIVTYATLLIFLSWKTYKYTFPDEATPVTDYYKPRYQLSLTVAIFAGVIYVAYNYGLEQFFTILFWFFIAVLIFVLFRLIVQHLCRHKGSLVKTKIKNDKGLYKHVCLKCKTEIFK